MLESVCDHIGAFGGTNGLNLKTGIPVLAKLDTQAGDHEWDGSTIEERIGQSGVFYFGATEDEATGTMEKPTANDEISTSDVKVIVGNGQITINGAAGRKVVVSNILGQVCS